MALDGNLGDDVDWDEDDVDLASNEVIPEHDVEVPEHVMELANFDDTELGMKNNCVSNFESGSDTAIEEQSDYDEEDSANEEYVDEEMQIDHDELEKGPFFMWGMTFANHEEMKKRDPSNERV